MAECLHCGSPLTRIAESPVVRLGCLRCDERHVASREAIRFSYEVEKRFGLMGKAEQDEHERRRFLRGYLGSVVVHTWRGSVDGDDGGGR